MSRLRRKSRRNLLKIFAIFNPQYSKRRAIKLMDQDWDYLIIIDACRYDMFTWFMGKQVPYVISGGSTTQEWIAWNFDKEFYDIVCIAGNPRFSSINLKKTFGINPFFKVIELWDFGWDKNIKTVHPKMVVKTTIKALKDYPTKRMLIHFNQPHTPFLDDMDLFATDVGNPHREVFSIWDDVKKGRVPLKRVWKAYYKNLEIVMKEVYELIDVLKGKVVITSDHGNLMGEFFRFGHIPHLRLKNLVKVPWYVIKNERRDTEITHVDDFEKDLSELGINETYLIKEKIKRIKKNGKI